MSDETARDREIAEAWARLEAQRPTIMPVSAEILALIDKVLEEESEQ